MTKADTIRGLRQIAGLNQFQASKLTKIERCRLSMAENGHVKLRPEEYERLESLLKPLAEQRSSNLMELLAV